MTDIGYKEPEDTGITQGGEIHYYKITMPEDGTLNSISVKTAGYSGEKSYAAIYDDNAGVPGDLIEEETTGAVNANWTAGAWHELTMAGTTSLSNATSYWLAVRSDGGTGERLRGNYHSFRWGGAAWESGASFPSSFGGNLTDGDCDYDYCIFATYEAGGGDAGTNTSVNIGDAWKSLSGGAHQVNIGDSWKAIAGMQVNVGDAWKAVVIA